MKHLLQFVLTVLLAATVTGCNQDGTGSGTEEEEQSSVVRKYRDDGTLSSINPLDEKGYVHGVKVNFYEDGNTIHSKISYQNGRKHGPAVWYFRSGQIHEHTTYNFGRKNGLTRKYYESGELMEEVTFDGGTELPGKKRYDKNGDLIR